jgi:hypothetical protein
MTKEEIIEKSLAVDGWFEKGDCVVMNSILSEYDHPITFLELGSWKGKSTTLIILSLPKNSKIICIDTFEGSENEQDTGHIEAREEGDPIYTQFMENLEAAKQLRPDIEVEVLRGDTLELSNNFEKLVFDIIFLDTNHQMQHVRNDFFTYVDKLKEDGILIGHDIHRGCPGVVTFVYSILGKAGVALYNEKGCSLWSIKRSQVDFDIVEQAKENLSWNLGEI